MPRGRHRELCGHRRGGRQLRCRDRRSRPPVAAHACSRARYARRHHPHRRRRRAGHRPGAHLDRQAALQAAGRPGADPARRAHVRGHRPAEHGAVGRPGPRDDPARRSARARRADPPSRAGATRTGSAGGGRRQGRPTGRDDDHGPTRLRHLVRPSRAPRRPVRGLRLRRRRGRDRRPAGRRAGRRARRAARRRAAPRRRRAGRAGARTPGHPPRRRAEPVGSAQPGGRAHARSGAGRVRHGEGDALDQRRRRGDLAAAVGHAPDPPAPRGDRRALPASHRGHRRGAAARA